jgi:hypothetical protein
LNAYVKGIISTADTIILQVKLFYNSVLVDSGLWIGNTPFSSYTQITIPITQSSSLADSCIVYFVGWGTYSAFWIDYLSWDTISALENIDYNNMLEIFPTPAREFIYVNFKGVKHSGPYAIRTYDVTGKICQTLWYGKNYSLAEKINISGLKNGFYMIEYDYGEGVYRKKIVKQ